MGFVPTPRKNNETLRLDARKLANDITQQARNKEQFQKRDNVKTKNSCIPSKLKQINYSQDNYKIIDSATKQAVDFLNCKMNALPSESNNKSEPNNLSYLENEGLKWLKTKTQNMEITITQADKGGSILIVPPSLLEKKIDEKVSDNSLFQKMEKDPRPELYDQIHECWVNGKTQKFINEFEAEKIMGITSNNNKSTLAHFKPGVTYFNPSLKIHKMQEEDIVPGCEPPARLISCFQDGITKRSDVFLAEKWLKHLEQDFCYDTVKDTNTTLKWLDNLDTLNSNQKKMFLPFTFDFQSLYDSLSPKLVVEALTFAIKKHRKNWSNEFGNWLIDLVKISLNSGVGIYKDKWYKSISGISTGGSLSVQLANITVFYALYQCVYSNDILSKDIVSIKRFIDDGVGIFKGTLRQFNNWKKSVTESLFSYNLVILEKDWKVAKISEYVTFLDIKFGFDVQGNLQTDLYKKETDARAYLNFNSCHPTHVFSSIVYSQALRVRRIVNDQTRLDKHLDDMSIDFKNSDYPQKLVFNIIQKVKSLPRNINQNSSGKDDNVMDDSIKVVSTYGCDKELCEVTESISQKLPLEVKYVKKTGTSLNNILCKSKHISTGPLFGKTKGCTRNRCKTCPYMSNKDISTSTSNNVFKTAPGNCTTRNVIYSAVCKLCSKPYVGKTTQMMCGRICEHKSCYNKYLKSKGNISPSNCKNFEDKFALAVHLYDEHGINNIQAFENSYEFTVLEKCSPKALTVKEHLWIQKIKSIYPLGLNLNSPLGLPLLL